MSQPSSQRNMAWTVNQIWRWIHITFAVSWLIVLLFGEMIFGEPGSARGDPGASLWRRLVHPLVCLCFNYGFFQMAPLPMVQEMEEQVR